MGFVLRQELNLQAVSKSTIATIVIVALFGGNMAFAATAQSLQISVPGGVLNAGDQNYEIHGSGLVMAQVQPYSFGSTAKFEYSLSVQVKGLTAHGNGHFEIMGTTPDNRKVSVSGDIAVNDMVPEAIPFGYTTACNSAIPMFFVGSTTTTVSVEGAKPVQIQTGLLLESPYLNPFGAPISVVSTDSATAPSIVIVTTYDKGMIEWTGSTVSGPISGLLGTSAVTGTSTLVTHEVENLVAGTTMDSGAMTFTSMNPNSLNSQGSFSGSSVIPKPGSPECTLEVAAFGTPCTSDCTAQLAAFGLPALPGTCTGTGLQSTGQFNLESSNQQGQPGGDNHVTVKGHYSTTWSQPALVFISSATATVSTGH